MKISAEQQYKNFYQRFMHDPKKGVQQFLPEWINDKSRPSIRAAQEVIASMQALINLRMACWKLKKEQQDFFDLKLQQRLQACISFVGLREVGKSRDQNLLQEILQSISDIYGISTDYANEICAEIRDIKEYNQIANELISHGFDRNGAMCTPGDVAILMSRLGREKNKAVDVYANYGYGLYQGASSDTSQIVNLVGDEDFTATHKRLLTNRLELAYRQAELSIDRFAVFERMLVELEWVLNYDYQRSEVLLVNAANIELPFFKSEDAPNINGELNHLFTKGYKKIIALVSNSYLNGGRGAINSQEIFEYCLKNGLKTVVQLPVGSIGASHEAYSILIFEPGTLAESIDFRVMDHGDENDPVRLFQTAERGFGKPFRQNALNLKSISEDGDMPQVRRNMVKVSDILTVEKMPFINSKRRSRLISFEAGRFIKEDLPKSLTDRFEFKKLSDLVDIYRIQHMQLSTPENGIEYLEIGGGDINQFGKYTPQTLTKKYIDKNSSGRLDKARLKNKELIFCIRGSVGKVAIADSFDKEPIAPNQSFVKLTLKQSITVIKPELIFWWLNSSIAEEHIRSKVLSVGVPRLSILDVGNIPIPVGPKEQISLEMKKYEAWTIEVNRLMLDLLKAQKMSLSAFNF